MSKRRDETGRRRPTQLRDQERDDILTLHAAGYSVSKIAEMMDRTDVVVARVIQEPRAVLRERFGEPLLASYSVAAEVAAQKGDHRPALEMLDRLGVIPESSRQRTTLLAAQLAAEAQANVTRHLQPATSPTVNIGIGLPAQLVSVSTTEDNRPLLESGKVSENGIPVCTQATLQGQVLEVVDKDGRSID